MVRKTLATSPSCGPCNVLKNRLTKLGISVENRSFDPDTSEWFAKHNIKSVPRLVVENDETGEARIIQGIDDIIEELQSN
jgi:glutaredoxin